MSPTGGSLVTAAGDVPAPGNGAVTPVAESPVTTGHLRRVFLGARGGVPQSQAVAAVFIQRLFAAYLPPIWGWFTLAWMRRREYV